MVKEKIVKENNQENDYLPIYLLNIPKFLQKISQRKLVALRFLFSSLIIDPYGFH